MFLEKDSWYQNVGNSSPTFTLKGILFKTLNSKIVYSVEDSNPYPAQGHIPVNIK